MIHIRSAGEIDKISKACQIVKETLEMVEEWVQPGITTLELDNKAEDLIRSRGAEPGFKDFMVIRQQSVYRSMMRWCMVCLQIGNFKKVKYFLWMLEASWKDITVIMQSHFQ